MGAADDAEGTAEVLAEARCGMRAGGENHTSETTPAESFPPKPNDSASRPRFESTAVSMNASWDSGNSDGMARFATDGKQLLRLGTSSNTVADPERLAWRVWSATTRMSVAGSRRSLVLECARVARKGHGRRSARTYRALGVRFQLLTA